MKRFLAATIVVLAIFLVGYLGVGYLGVPKFVIPDEPQFQKMHIYQFEQGICLDNADAEILKGNIKALRDYADRMRKTLEGLQKPE